MDRKALKFLSELVADCNHAGDLSHPPPHVEWQWDSVDPARWIRKAGPIILGKEGLKELKRQAPDHQARLGVLLARVKLPHDLPAKGTGYIQWNFAFVKWCLCEGRGFHHSALLHPSMFEHNSDMPGRYHAYISQHQSRHNDFYISKIVVPRLDERYNEHYHVPIGNQSVRLHCPKSHEPALILKYRHKDATDTRVRKHDRTISLSAFLPGELYTQPMHVPRDEFLLLGPADIQISRCWGQSLAECHEPRFPESQLLFDMAAAIRHLHSLGVHHNAIHEEHVLFDQETMRFKLCNFDYATTERDTPKDPSQWLSPMAAPTSQELRVWGEGVHVSENSDWMLLGMLLWFVHGPKYLHNMTELDRLHFEASFSKDPGSFATSLPDAVAQFLRDGCQPWTP